MVWGVLVHLGVLVHPKPAALGGSSACGWGPGIFMGVPVPGDGGVLGGYRGFQFTPKQLRFGGSQGAVGLLVHSGVPVHPIPLPTEGIPVHVVHPHSGAPGALGELDAYLGVPVHSGGVLVHPGADLVHFEGSWCTCGGPGGYRGVPIFQYQLHLAGPDALGGHLGGSRCTRGSSRGI